MKNLSYTKDWPWRSSGAKGKGYLELHIEDIVENIDSPAHFDHMLAGDEF
jgi:hypothetical protein